MDPPRALKGAHACPPRFSLFFNVIMLVGANLTPPNPKMDPPRAPKDAPKGAPEGAQWTPRLLHFYHRPTPFPHLQPIYQNPPQVPYARTGAPFGGSWSVRGTLLKTMTPVDLPIYDDISCKRWPSNPLWLFLEVPSDKRLPPVKVYVRTRCISRPPRRFVFFFSRSANAQTRSRFIVEDADGG